MTMSTYLSTQLLNTVFDSVSYTAPANCYVALSTTEMSASATPTEPVGNNYSRGEVVFSTAVSGVTTTSADVSFSCTGNTWPQVVGCAVMDASTGGNVLVWFNILPRTVAAGETLVIATGDITVSIL